MLNAIFFNLTPDSMLQLRASPSTGFTLYDEAEAIELLEKAGFSKIEKTLEKDRSLQIICLQAYN
jgi:hypothetical protein